MLERTLEVQEPERESVHALEVVVPRPAPRTARSRPRGALRRPGGRAPTGAGTAPAPCWSAGPAPPALGRRSSQSLSTIGTRASPSARTVSAPRDRRGAPRPPAPPPAAAASGATPRAGSRSRPRCGRSCSRRCAVHAPRNMLQIQSTAPVGHGRGGQLTGSLVHPSVRQARGCRQDPVTPIRVAGCLGRCSSPKTTEPSPARPAGSRCGRRPPGSCPGTAVPPAIRRTASSRTVAERRARSPATATGMRETRSRSRAEWRSRPIRPRRRARARSPAT